MREKCIKIGADGVARESWRDLTDWEIGQLRADRLAAMRRELRESGEPLLEALEDILTATSLTGLLTAVVRQARALREVLRERIELRLKIADVEKEGES